MHYFQKEVQLVPRLFVLYPVVLARCKFPCRRNMPSRGNFTSYILVRLHIFFLLLVRIKHIILTSNCNPNRALVRPVYSNEIPRIPSSSGEARISRALFYAASPSRSSDTVHAYCVLTTSGHTIPPDAPLPYTVPPTFPTAPDNDHSFYFSGSPCASPEASLSVLFAQFSPLSPFYADPESQS